MKKAIFIIIVLFTLISCKTKTIYVPIENTKTEYKNNYVRDSIYLLDSVFVDRFTKNDTVSINKEKFKYIYKDRFNTDTIIKVDSIRVPYPVIETKEVNKIHNWQIILMVLGGCMIGYLGLRVATKWF